MNINEFLGEWENFENYFDDASREMTEAWNDAETAVKEKKDLVSKILFRNGAKAFWQKACYTITKDNPVRIGYWNVMKENDHLMIIWYDQNKKELGKYAYEFCGTIENGLEKKENYLLESNESSPFRYVLLMPPMKSESVISHLHFQFASKKEELLIRNNRLKNKHWYATMCEGKVSEKDRCNIVRALHGLPY